MVVKKATAKKTAVKPKAPARKAAKNDRYVCEVCGLGVIIDEELGYAEFHEILCCGKPMKPRKAPVKAGK